MKKILFFLIFFSAFLNAQSDCNSALTVCGNSSISYTPSGHGQTQETLGGCLFQEHYSVWYAFTIQTGGTLTMTITPNAQADYDWAIYGPNTTCGNLGGPVRCSYASTFNGILTGMNMTATDLSENAGGDGWVKYMDVLPGQTYYLIVDNFSANANGFSLTWGGTATLASPFNDPAYTPNPFIAPGPNQDGNVIICTNPAIFDFSTLTAGIINGNANFEVSYHNNQNDALSGNAPIVGPVTVNTANTYYYSIHYQDPTNPNNPINGCKQFGQIHFTQGAITVNNATVNACNNNNQGIGVFDLTSVSTAMYADPTATKKYYPTLADMNAGTNEIIYPTMYTTAVPAQVYMKVTTTQNCTAYGVITLEFYPVVVTQPALLTSCFIEGNPTTGEFNLEDAGVTTQTGVTKKYYPSLQDAINQNNEILNPTNYISTSTTIYVRVTNANGCWGTGKITLEVTPPVYSLVLKDKIICIEDKTTLDAGPGFEAYLWSTGETTQSISNVTVGEYWVMLTTEGCPTMQKVKVIKSPEPVITNIDITNNTVNVMVNGGTKPYKFSLDGSVWQESNVFTNVPRGMNFIYVKDAYDCNPVIVQITVPNLINAITPNNDNINDYVDYSALAYKKNVSFTVFDRYGTPLARADKNNGYKWDGRAGGKNLPTGTYWYSITWNEPGTDIPVKYSGWIMVKNR